MPENNYNMIKPVEGLQSLAGLNPVGQRRQRQRRQELNNENEHEEKEEQAPEETEQQPEDIPGDELARNRIDFKA